MASLRPLRANFIYLAPLIEKTRRCLISLWFSGLVLFPGRFAFCGKSSTWVWKRGIADQPLMLVTLLSAAKRIVRVFGTGLAGVLSPSVLNVPTLPRPVGRGIVSNTLFPPQPCGGAKHGTRKVNQYPWRANAISTILAIYFLACRSRKKYL